MAAMLSGPQCVKLVIWFSLCILDCSQCLEFWVVQLWSIFSQIPTKYPIVHLLGRGMVYIDGLVLERLAEPISLCNRMADFLHSKFCGIVWACSCALLWSFPHLPYMGLSMGQQLAKFATNWLQTLRNAFLWNCWMDLPHLKFHGLV